MAARLITCLDFCAFLWCCRKIASIHFDLVIAIISFKISNSFIFLVAQLVIGFLTNWVWALRPYSILFNWQTESLLTKWLSQILTVGSVTQINPSFRLSFCPLWMLRWSLVHLCFFCSSVGMYLRLKLFFWFPMYVLVMLILFVLLPLHLIKWLWLWFFIT